MARRSIKLG